ncbi:hypothetical protein BGZ52_008853 [Haplosporangium bisporale]|nr:hypothetical protein BGZ52_008853 [Haplosporangium bisporale]
MSVPGSSKPSKSAKRAEPLPGQEYATQVPAVVNPSGKPRLPFSREEIDALSAPKVLISGGGIGGLTLALLLYKANVPFLVLERAKEIKSLGSAIGLGASIAPLFKQLGIYDEFVKRGKVCNQMHMYKEDLTPVHTMDMRCLQDVIDSKECIISRPDLYDILFNSIPRERIHLGKRVLSLTQNEDNVMVRCSDNSTYLAEILVGADGAYSAVRQHLYKDLKIKKKLPASDDVSLPFSCVCLVGQTTELDPEEFPHMNEETSQMNTILGISTMCTWLTFTTKQNTVCWMVIHFLDKDSAKRNDSFRNSEWGSEAAEELAREVRVFKVPGGKDGKVLTLGDYIDKTPSHLMSKVMLEEIVFSTWHGGRVVLLGDACHKMNPSGALGAVSAIHDAVTLANWMSTLRLAGPKEVDDIFKEYRAERYPVAKANFKTSQLFIRNMGKNMLASLVRGLMKRIPHWIWKRIVMQYITARPQASFLPLEEDRCTVKPLYQRSLHKTLPILKELAENPTILASETNASAPVSV